jgi:hypothetical protein
MSLALILTTLLAANAPADRVPERASLSIGPGERLSAVLTGVDQQHENQRPRLTIKLTKSGQAERKLVVDLTPEKYPELANLILGSFFWTVEANMMDLGGKQVARIGVFAGTGEDLMEANEIAILLDIEQEPKLLWIGLGDREVNRFDVCMIKTVASFRLMKDGQLERRTRSVKHIGKVEDGDEGMAAYARDCKTPKRQVQVFPFLAGQRDAGPDG